jgi:hypothetical protein
MKIVVAAFYADIIGQSSRFDEFLPFMLASKHALSVTNPSASYIVLTDHLTAKLFERHDLRYIALAPEHMPLMTKIVFTQQMFMSRCDADLIVLPDVDCIVNRDLSDSIPEHVGMAITHRGKKFWYSINNLAYIRDRELAKWFLSRAYWILHDWPLELRTWGGDQRSWEASLDGAIPNPDSPLGLGFTYKFETVQDDILVSRPEGRDIYLYPCRTHNCFMNDAGIIKDNHRNAFTVHFKGARKQHLSKWMKERFGYNV